nr:MAG TPA: baseplate protein [Caudoviricetes sp.]
MENTNVTGFAMGQFRDRVYDVETGELIKETEWSKNTIVNGLNKAISYAFAGMGGLSYWAIGSGAASWDTTQPIPSATDTQLTNEIGRKIIPASAFAFLDGDGQVTTTPTNVLQITLTFGANDCNGNWREFALYGGNATNQLGSGVMINHKIHTLQTKTTSVQIQRQIKFTFNNNN